MASKKWRAFDLAQYSALVASRRLGSGESTPGDIDVIVSQMKQCPVSRNLGDIPHAESTVSLN